MAGFGMLVIGDKELLRMLEGFSDAALRKFSRPSIRIASRPTLQDAKRRARALSKTLGKSIGRKSATYKRSGVVAEIIGPRRGFKNQETGHDPANTAHLFEFGTGPHEIKTKGGGILSNINDPGSTDIEVFGRKVRHPGQAATPWLRPAFTANKGRAVTVYSSEFRKRILAEARRKGRR